MKKSRKCQVSVESAIAVGIIFIIFVFMLFFAYRINNDKRQADSAAELENECARLSSLAAGVHNAGRGSHANTTLNNNITVEHGSTIFLESGDKEASCRSRVPLTNSTSSTFRVPKGRISISSYNSSVLVEKTG